VTKWVLPLKQRAGADFLLNLNVVCMQSSCAPVRANPAEYAEFGVTVLEHLRSTFNLTPQYFELMLEPQVTGTELGQDWAALRTRMQAAGFTGIKFIAPSLVNSNQTVSYAKPSWPCRAILHSTRSAIIATARRLEAPCRTSRSWPER
jgi:hypothetical protein